MADIISRLKLESGEFDSKIKRAGQELMAYSEHCRKTGLIMGYSNQDARDFAKALGSMQTTSSTARGKISELSDAFVNLRVMYKNMTDEEKNNQFGKNLAASLDQLKTRIQDAKKDLADVTAELNGASSGGKGGFLSGIGDKMGGAMQVFAGNMMTKAVGAIANLGSEMYDMVQQGVELARQGEGIRIAFERLGRGDILDGLREATHGTVTDLELMKAAVKFNDFKLPVEELGTMLAFAQQKAKDTGQSVDYMVDSIVTGLGRKSLMILDNLGLSASEIKERMAQTGDMTKAVGDIIRDQMSKAGDYVETAADRAAQANVSLQNKMEELGRKFAPVEEASNQLWTSMKISILDVVGGPLARLLNGLTEAGRLKNMLDDMNGGGNGKETQTEKALRLLRQYSGGGRGIEGKRDLYNRQVASYSRQEEKAWREANRLREELNGLRRQQKENGLAGNLQPLISDTSRRLEAAENRAKAFQIIRANYAKGAEEILNPVTTNTPITIPTNTSGSRSNTKKEQTEMQRNQTRINDLTQKYVTLMAAASEAGKPLTDEQQKQTSEIQRQISELEKRNGQLKLYEEQANGKLLGPDAFKQQLSVDVAVNNKKIEELERQLLSLNGITIDPKTVTITATDDALPKLREIQGITIDDKTMTVTAETADALRALQAVEGVTIDPKTVTITATDEALPKLREIQGITIDDKTMTVTADTLEALQALQAVEGVTIDTKSVKVTAETDEARQKVEELKRQIAELKDQNIQITAAMGTIGMPLSEIPRMGVTDVTYGKGKSQFVPAPLMPSMSDVVRQRGGNLLDDKAMKAVNEDISRNLPNAKEKDSPLESGKKLLSGIIQLTDGLEKIGIDIPDEIQSVITVIQGVMQVIEAVNTIIGGAQTAALTTNTVAMGVLTEALWANTASSWLPFANGGIVPKFAGGGLVGRAALGMTIPGNSFSGDNLRMPVVGGGMIGVNSGEVILNRAQAGVIASDLQGSGMQNLKLDAVISGEQIRLVLNNNGRRTGRGEYVQSTRRR